MIQCKLGILFCGACLLASFGTASALPLEVYTADFENGAPAEFSSGSTSSAQIGAEALNQGLSTYHGKFTLSGTSTLTLTGLPPHTELELEFDAYFFNSWDGNATSVGPDFFSLAGDVTFSETFTNHRGEGDSYPGVADVFLNSAGTALSSFGDSGSTMAFFRLGPTMTGSSFVVTHTGSTFTVSFAGPTSQTDEQWGIDNVRVSIDGEPATIPSLSSWGLLLLGGFLIMLGMRRMRLGTVRD